MFFFENYTVLNVLSAIALLAALFIINEATRRSKLLSIGLFVVVPVLFTLFVWPYTGGSGTASGYWFAWIKTYSALAGVVGFMMLRYLPKLQKNRFMILFPALILAINILEAVLRDFQCYKLTGVLENGLYLQGGIWNLLNGCAGLLSIITITGWVGIRVSKGKFNDMVWPDMHWFYIVSYCLWNISYVYNCIPNRAFYAGVIILSLSLISGLLTSKGLWLQHRAQILALFAMFTLTFPSYSTTDYFSITSTLKTSPMLILSILSLSANVMVFAYQIYKMIKTKKNPLKEELYSDLKAYTSILKSNHLQ